MPDVVVLFVVVPFVVVLFVVVLSVVMPTAAYTAQLALL